MQIRLRNALYHFCIIRSKSFFHLLSILSHHITTPPAPHVATEPIQYQFNSQETTTTRQEQSTSQHIPTPRQARNWMHRQILGDLYPNQFTLHPHLHLHTIQTISFFSLPYLSPPCSFCSSLSLSLLHLPCPAISNKPVVCWSLQTIIFHLSMITALFRDNEMWVSRIRCWNP